MKFRKFYKSKRYNRLKRRRSNKKIARVARRVVNNAKEWKFTFNKVPTSISYTSATGTLSQNHQQLVGPISQGDLKWADVSSAPGAIRDGNSILVKAIFLKQYWILPNSSIASYQSFCVRWIIWEPKHHQDIDDALAAMSGAGQFVAQTSAGNIGSLVTAYVDPDLINVHMDKVMFFGNAPMDNFPTQRKVKKMMKMRRQEFDFPGNATVYPKNRQLYSSIYCISTVVAVSQTLYGSQFIKCWIKDK